MRSHIDWLTFTGNQNGSGDADFPTAILNGLYDLIGGELMEDVCDGEGKQRERSRAPYTYAWEWAASNVVIFASETLSHFTVEISGQGCERLIERGDMESLLERVKERVTRIDVACDIETAVKPTEFVSAMAHERMRSSGYQRSETGETCYVGSQKSERYARVYRYAEPHPRAHLLRIEHVFRREHAKMVAGTILVDGIDSASIAAGEAFGWKHHEWNPAKIMGSKIPAVYVERGGGKTIFWLVNSVAPAFKRLCADGTIPSAEEFLQRYFLAEE